MPNSTFTPSGCAVCAHSKVFADPDPTDWFCDDDVKVVCMKADRNITVACRPYNIAEECSYMPSWCPQGGQITPRSL